MITFKNDELINHRINKIRLEPIIYRNDKNKAKVGSK